MSQNIYTHTHTPYTTFCGEFYIRKPPKPQYKRTFISAELSTVAAASLCVLILRCKCPCAQLYYRKFIILEGVAKSSRPRAKKTRKYVCISSASDLLRWYIWYGVERGNSRRDSNCTICIYKAFFSQITTFSP